MSAKCGARENVNFKTEDKSKSPKNVYLIAQDIKFAKVLACNNKKLRDRALKSLKKWFQHRSTKLPFTEDDFMRIWKGLFYSMWMSDKPLIQEEVAENISSLIHFVDSEVSFLFFKTGLLTLMQQWNGIDQLRFDKFLMFMRRLLRQAIVVLKNHKWKGTFVTKFCNTLTETVLNANISPPLGLTMHITDIYLEEIAKISEGKIHPSLTTQLVKPFVKYLATLNDKTQINHVKENIFYYLLRQSEAAAAFEERFEAWKQMGFAGGTIDAITKEVVEEDDIDVEEDGSEPEEDGNKPLDPRAGRVDVVLPRLKFSAKEIANVLQEHKFVDGSSTKAKKAIDLLMQHFKKMAKGNYPLGMKKLNLPKNDGYSTKLKHSVNRLVKFEKKIMGKNKNKSKKHKTENETPAEPPKKKRKRENHSTNGSDDGAADFFRKQLEDFVQKSEAGTTRKHKTKKIKNTPENTPTGFDYSFRRNSGTWFVFTEENEQTIPISNSPLEQQNSEPPPQEETPKPVRNVKEAKTNEETPKGKQLFDTDEWETPLQEGEMEIFVPARKRSKSLEKFNTEKSDGVVKNPFSKNNTPSSSKKVKIDLKLNTSQEFHEHHAQILSSPAIPFDASKRPLKPLLKPSAVSSPINPFYKKRSSFMMDSEWTL